MRSRFQIITVVACMMLLSTCSPQPGESNRPTDVLVSEVTGVSLSPTSTEAIPSPTSIELSPTASLAPTELPPTDEPDVDPTKTISSVTLEPVVEDSGEFFNSPEYGMQVFMWWHLDIGERDLDAVNELDFGWVKQSLAWRDIETIEKGKRDWFRSDEIVTMVEEAGLNLLVRIDRQPFWSQETEWPPLDNAPPADSQDFADFCGAMAKRYKGRIHAYQIWNEPNLSREWGEEPPDPEGYVELLKVCYLAIKEADPEAIVVSAGLAPTGTGLPVAIPDDEYLQAMYDAGAADYFDVLGLNAPGFKAPPEASPEEGELNPEYGGGRWFVFRHVEDMRALMEANGDGDKQIAILELGWTTDILNPNYSWHAVTEEQQADYLVRAYEYAAENWRPWIGPIFTIYLADYDWTSEENEQWWWAISLPDGTRRPAFDALRDMEKQDGGVIEAETQ